jgi:hypothetical protein
MQSLTIKLKKINLIIISKFVIRTVFKVMELLLRDEMMEQTIRNNLLEQQQHGFVKFKSCVTN